MMVSNIQSPNFVAFNHRVHRRLDPWFERNWVRRGAWALFGGLMATLPTMINNDRGENLQPAVDRVWAAALTLILLIFVLNLLGRFIGRFSKVKG